MKLPFKFDILEQAEEKFYFRTSHFFWHLLAGIGGLALVGGILVYLWGITPSIKPSVKKPVYPPPIAVTADEISQRLSPPAKGPEVTSKEPEAYLATSTTTTPTQPAKTDTLAIAYQAAIDTLQKLLPPSRFAWDSQHRFEERGWYYGQWHEGGWKVVAVGISAKLENAYGRANTYDLPSRTELLRAYAGLIALFPEPLRLEVLETAIEISKNDVTTSVAGVNLLKAAAPIFSTYNTNYLRYLTNFSQRNPRDGHAFIEYANTIAPKFDTKFRVEALETLMRSYYQNFDDIVKQREATDLFMGMLADFPAIDQAKALGEYFQLYAQKNYERAQAIRRLDENYQIELSKAESVLAEKKAKKARLRSLAWRAVAGSVVLIAFIALFLVLLSIQRNIKQMREAAAPAK